MLFKTWAVALKPRRTTNQQLTFMREPGLPAYYLLPQKDRWAVQTGTLGASSVGVGVSAPPFLHRTPFQTQCLLCTYRLQTKNSTLWPQRTEPATTAVGKTQTPQAPQMIQLPLQARCLPKHHRNKEKGQLSKQPRQHCLTRNSAKVAWRAGQVLGSS